MRDTAVNGLRLLGDQGGYIDYSKFGLSANTDPTSSTLVRFSPGSKLSVPYWFYLSSENQCSENCEFKYGRPNLYRNDGDPSIEGQLDEYVKKNIDICLNNFDVFREQGFDVAAQDDPKVITTLTDSDVLFNLNYPITAKRESSKKITSFFVRIPLNLKRIYEQATLITNLEAEYHYIERDVINLLFGFSGLDENKLPPMSDTDFEMGDGIKWSKKAVQGNVQSMLTTYIQFLQVLGSANYAPYDFPSGSMENALYNTGMLVPTNESSESVSIFFNYLDFWPIYFDLNCNGDVCKAESMSANFMSLFGLQKYNFYYDLSFPVMVEFHDSTALNNRGYNFRLFLEANIRNNEPLKSNFVQLQTNPIGESLLCDENVRNSGMIEVKVSESLENKPLENAEVIYSCTGQSCFIGKTQNGALNQKFPICLGGFINILKEGYIGKSQLLTTKLDSDDSKEIILDPINSFRFDVRKYYINKGTTWDISGSPSELDDKETAIITIQRNGEITDGEFSSYAIIGGDIKNGTIDLAPGIYTLDIQIKNDNNLVVPKETRSAGSWPLKKDYDLPEIKMNSSFMSGGVKINFTVTLEDMKQESVTLFAVSPNLLGIPEIQRTFEDLDQLNKIQEYSMKYSSMLKPLFK